MAEQNDTQYTDIEIIVFEDEDGSEIEMEIIDEFEMEGVQYMALRPPIDPMDEDSDEDSIAFFRCETDEKGEEVFDLVEDKDTLAKVMDMLEDRLLAD